MAGRSSHAKPLDSRWVLVDTRDSLGRICQSAVPVTGARFGSLVVLHAVPGKYGEARCACDCGREWTGPARELRRGRATRCGKCGWAHAGRQRTDAEVAALFPNPDVRALWRHRYCGIVSRCYDPNHAAFARYGGRGIEMHPAWRKDRLAFFKYVRTLDGWDNLALDLDRIDNNRGYVPGNLRLCSRSENANNRSRTRKLRYEGREWSLRVFLRRFCPEWTASTIYYHLGNGRAPEWIVARYRATHPGVGSA